MKFPIAGHVYVTILDVFGIVVRAMSSGDAEFYEIECEDPMPGFIWRGNGKYLRTVRDYAK